MQYKLYATLLLATTLVACGGSSSTNVTAKTSKKSLTIY